MKVYRLHEGFCNVNVSKTFWVVELILASFFCLKEQAPLKL